MWIHLGENFIDIWGGADFGPYSSQSFQFVLLNYDIFVRKLKAIYMTSTDFYVLWRLRKREKSYNIFLHLNYIINFIRNFTVEMLLKYNGIQKEFVSNNSKKNQKPKNITCFT